MLEEDEYLQLAAEESGEWGSRDATSAGPPVTEIVNNMKAYTAANLLILRDAIQAELTRRILE